LSVTVIVIEFAPLASGIWAVQEVVPLATPLAPVVVFVQETLLTPTADEADPVTASGEEVDVVEDVVTRVGGVGPLPPTWTGLTVSVAALLVTLPAAFVTVTWKVDPLSDSVVAGVVYVAAVAPPIGIPSFSHWNWRGSDPPTATVKVAEVPTVTL
jgi:hypothetical protein